MLNRLLIPIKISWVMAMGLVFTSAVLSGENGLPEKVSVVGQQEVSSVEATDGIATELQGLTKLLTERVAADDAALQQSPGVKSLLQLLKAGLEVQKNMTDALPQDLRTRIERFFAQYSDFVARVHAPHAIYKLGIDIQKNLGTVVKEGEAPSLTALRDVFQYGMGALHTGLWGEMFDTMNIKHKTDVREMLGDVFAGAVLGGHNPLMGVAIGGNPKNARAQDMADADFDDEEEDFYDLIDLKELVDALHAADADFKAAFPACDAFTYFTQYVEAVATEDVHALANVAFVYLEPIYLATTRELFDIQEKLFTLFEESIGQAPTATAPTFDGAEGKRDHAARVMDAMDGVLNQEQSQMLYSKNPYFYWLSSLKRHEGSCTAYAFIKRRFKKEGVGKEYFQLFRLFAHAYTFTHHCLDIYHNEVDRVVNIDERRMDAAKKGKNAEISSVSMFNKFHLVPTLLNYALTSTVAANYFFKVQEVARNSVYYDALMNKGSITDMRTQARAFVADYIGIAAAAPTLSGSPLKGIAVRSHLRNKVEKLAASWVYYHVFYNGLFNRNAFFRGKDAKGNDQPDKGTVSLWPTDFRAFRRALLGTIDYSVDFLSLVAEASCYHNLNPEIVADVNDATLGVVNPGAIRYVFRAFLPMLMMGPAGSLLKLSPVSIESYFYGEELDWYQDTAQEHGMSTAGLYAERALFDYAVGELGYNTGYWIGNVFHKEIWSGAGKVFRGLIKAGDAIGIGMGDSQEMADVMEFAGMRVADMAVDYVKMFLWPSAEMEQMMEPFVRGYLLEHGYLGVDDDKGAYREAVVNMVLSQLALQGLIKRYDAAIYAREFKKNPTMDTVDVICRKIAQDFKQHLVCMGTGKLGRVLVEWAGDKAYMKYGPITPRVRKLFN